MKLFVGAVAVLLAGCAASPTTTDNGPVERCTVADCFNTRDIRNFVILNDSTAVVFVGARRCPFVVDLDGFSCNPSVAPRIRFYQAGMAGVANAGMSGRVCRSTQQLYLYTGLADLEPPLTSGRPGSFGDIGNVSDAGVRPLGGGVIPPDNSDLCHVRDVHSITDDQLLELYVKAGVAPPPPPIGSGKIEVPGPGAAGPGGSPASSSQGQGATGQGATGTSATGQGDASGRARGAGEGDVSPSTATPASHSGTGSAPTGKAPTSD